MFYHRTAIPVPVPIVIAIAIAIAAIAIIAILLLQVANRIPILLHPRSSLDRARAHSTAYPIRQSPRTQTVPMYRVHTENPTAKPNNIEMKVKNQSRNKTKTKRERKVTTVAIICTVTIIAVSKTITIAKGNTRTGNTMKRSKCKTAVSVNLISG
jgi:ABC-type anion transport system duplicated permease subunit